MVEQEEESGWTSYLDTDCPSLSLLSDSAYNPHSMSLSTAYHADQIAQSFQNTSLNRHRHHKVAARKGNSYDEDDDQQTAGCKSDGRADFSDEESCGSSTLSDAHSSLGAQPQKQGKPSRNNQRLKRKRDGNCMVSKDPLEDTATSSPSSNQISKYTRLDISSYSVKYGELDVSKTFKALGALIPCLNEMIGKANEEEILNAIISHVRALEQKVQLLSDVWHLSQVNRG